MKKLFTLTLAIVALASIVSCGKDDANPDNLMIDETNLAPLVLNAYMIDNGYCCSEARSEGIPNTTYTKFLLTDGEFMFDSEGVITDFVEGDLELEIEMDVESEGTSFSTGAYDLYEYCSENNPTRGVTVNAFWFDGENEYNFGHDGGTLSITGSGTNYTLSFDGLLVDYSNGLARQEECTQYANVEITGKIKKNFTAISEDVYDTWYYGQF